MALRSAPAPKGGSAANTVYVPFTQLPHCHSAGRHRHSCGRRVVLAHAPVGRLRCDAEWRSAPVSGSRKLDRLPLRICGRRCGRYALKLAVPPSAAAHRHKHRGQHNPTHRQTKRIHGRLQKPNSLDTKTYYFIFRFGQHCPTKPWQSVDVYRFRERSRP
jgi:hypothetical protein